MNKITPVMIRNFLLAHKEVLFQCVLALVLYHICSYKIDHSVITIALNDEFGYWTNSSFLMGIEWPSITKNITYYSYGYSFILAIVRLVVRAAGYTDPAVMYRSACVLNLWFIVCSFFLAARICKRYMHNLNWITRNAVCLVVMLYPANLYYSHVTLPECTMMFLFWVFIYTMMRVTDKPGILNHIAFGALAVYIYVVHQRAVSVVITAILVAAFVKLVRISRMRDVTAFFATVYIAYLLQTVMKKNLQNVLYLGNPKVGFGELMSYMFSKNTAVMLAMALFVLLLLYLVDKGRGKLACALLIVGVSIAALYLAERGISGTAEQVSSKIAVNDFAGQWGKVAGIFSKYGLIRLGTSIVGKWLYLAAATGLVICWGMRGLFVNAFWMTVDAARKAFCMIRGKENKTLKRLESDYRAHIWFLGVFLAWFGAFLISAIYKEGLYTVDDLVNGRYVEYTIGVLVIYSVDRLLADKHWFMMLIVCLVLYVAAGEYCQHVCDIVERDRFVPMHALMLGLLFEKNAIPIGKFRELAEYVVPLSVGFVLLLKLFSNRISEYRINLKVVTARCIVALIIPTLVWNHISYKLLDNLCLTFDNWSNGAPRAAVWVNLLDNGQKIYCTTEVYYRKAELIQFSLADKVVEYTPFSELSFDEDAIYFINSNQLQEPVVAEKCELICGIGDYSVVINKNQEIMKRWNSYREILQR